MLLTASNFTNLVIKRIRLRLLPRLLAHKVALYFAGNTDNSYEGVCADAKVVAAVLKRLTDSGLASGEDNIE